LLAEKTRDGTSLRWLWPNTGTALNFYTLLHL
jgi:hypothetical protein